jgi:hypothetical protein
MAVRGGFNPTTWNSGAAPGISAAELQKIEDQIDVLDEVWWNVNHIDVPAVLQIQAARAFATEFGGAVLPVFDGSKDLGNSTKSWAGLYAYDIYDENGVVRLNLNADWSPGGNVWPTTSNAFDLGLTSNWWRVIHYATLTQHSDERDKPYIAPLSVPIAALRALVPIRFRRDGEDRTSFGFGAQTLDVWLADWLPAGDYSIVTAPGSDPDERWGMDGTQLIPALVGWMQELLERVEALEAG